MKRFLNAAVALAVTLVAYQVYTLAIVPIVEPTLAVRAYEAAGDDEWEIGAHAVGRWQQMLRSYLPEGHWALTGTPQVYEYEPMVLVLDDFRPVEGGRVEITKCLLLAFPTPREPGSPPPRDAILVEAPDRAIIQFDRVEGALDFTSGEIGRPIAGKFPGELVIRSDMREPGPQDDLRIVTRDLWFDLSKIATNADVSLRLGPHHARGRQMEIRLLKEEHAGVSKMPIAGIQSLEIFEQVQAVVDVGNLDAGGALRPNRRQVTREAYDPRQPIRRVAAESPLAGDGPLELTAAGSFHFDFTRFEAWIEDDVRATLRRADGNNDRLFCRQLRVFFGDQVLNPDDEPDLARRQSSKLSDLQPRLLEAIGAPVRLESPSRQAAVRGRRLRAWLVDRRLRIEGAPAQLAHGLSEVQAPWLEYTAPPEDSPEVIGEFLAAGPGWMRMTPNAEQPDRTYEARWKDVGEGANAVYLARDQRGQPLLTMTGRPEFAATGFGKLRADRLSVQIREVPADGREGPAIELVKRDNPNEPGAILLKRIDANGTVEFVGKEIEGSAEDLTALLRPIAAARADQPSGPSLGSPVGFAQGNSKRERDGRRFNLHTKSIQLDIGLAGRRTTPLSVACSGGVLLTGEATADGKPPLKIVGSQLRADRLDRRGGARLTIAGDDSATTDPNGERTGLAEISAQGMHVWVRDLHVDQAAGRAWTEGRGDARVLIPQRPGATTIAGEATLRWRGGMDFDGSRLALRDEVFAETRDGWLNCSTLAATLSRPIDLRGGSFDGGEVDVQKVECSGSVTIDYRTTDDAGQRSHERARLATLGFDRLSGAIAGQGPGSVRSVRLAGSSPSLLGQSAPANSSNRDGLRFLRVDFRDDLAGNLNDRALRFRGRVQTVYGPVLAWDHQLPLRSPEGVPPDAVELQCEEMHVHEDPAATVNRGSQTGAPFGPIELQARDSVRIEATIGDKGGALIAEAATASYSQAADRFVLAGDGQQLARLSARPDATQPFVPASAGRLTHYLSLGRTKIEDLRGVEYQPPPSASRPGLPRR